MAATGDEGEAGPGKGGTRRRIAELGPGWISAIGTLVAAVVAAVGLLIASSSGGGPSTASVVGGSEAGREALPPALVPPAGEVCSEQLFFAVNGTAGPLACPDGRLNVRAWEHYATTEPFVMTLGPDATPVDAGRAMCADIDRIETTISIEEDAYRAAALYYGWDFSLDPTELFPENC